MRFDHRLQFGGGTQQFAAGLARANDIDSARTVRIGLADRIDGDEASVVLSPDANLLESGLVDSIGLVELILRLEDHFGMELPMESLEFDDLRSINTIADLITRLSCFPLARAVGE